MTDWQYNIDTPRTRYMVMDAMGEPVDGVIAARSTQDGVEIWAQAVSPEGKELVASTDDGQTMESVQAYMNIPGGMLIDVTDDEE